MPSRAEAVLEEAAAKIKSEADDLRRLIVEKEEVHRRELEPLRRELDELDAAVARIEGRDLRPRSTGGRAAHGHNRKAILDALAHKKSLTAAEISEHTAISKATIHAALARLQSEGLVVKRRSERGVEHSLA